MEALAAVARNIIDSNMYMTLGTADENGLPWVSPLYYAPAGYTEFFWVSSPAARHSENIAVRPEVSIVVFDSGAPIGTGQGTYMAAVAEELTEAELERGIEIFSRRSQEHGGREWTADDVSETSSIRLYRATASEHFVVDPAASPNRLTPVEL